MKKEKWNIGFDVSIDDTDHIHLLCPVCHEGVNAKCEKPNKIYIDICGQCPNCKNFAKRRVYLTHQYNNLMRAFYVEPNDVMLLKMAREKQRKNL